MLDRRFGFIVLLEALFFLPGIQTSSGIYSYIIAPRYIVPGSEYVATVDMFNYLDKNPGTFDVTLSLTTSPAAVHHIVSETKAMSNGNSRGIFALKIPYKVLPSVRIYVDVTSHGVLYERTSLYTTVRAPSDDVILVQTDKGVYKAGQTVQFRVMTVSRNREVEVRPVTIDILDGDGNRIRRWANVTDNSGVFVGKMEMAQYPVLGTWSIRVKSEEITKVQEFEVQEYELPKFDVTLKMPEVVTSLDSTLEGSVSSLYTFGKGVTGSVEFILSYSTRKLSKIYKFSDGQVDIEILTSDIYEVLGIKPTSFNSLYSVKATATVTEDITGNTRDDSVNIMFMKFNVGIKLESQSVFLIGQPYLIKGRITTKNGSPYVGEAAGLYGLRLTVQYRSVGSNNYKTWISNKVLLIDNRNQFSFTINEQLIADQITKIETLIDLILTKTQEHLNKWYHYAYPMETIDGTLLYIKHVTGTNPLNIGETATYRISMTGPGTLTATYNVISKGIVVQNGKWFSISENKPYDVEVKAATSMKPLFAVVCWFILPNARINSSLNYDNVAVSGVTTSIRDDAEETSMRFQKLIQRPGENALLILKASTVSTFYVLAVDKSVLLLDEGNDITEKLLPDLYDDFLTDINFGGSRYPGDVLSRAKLHLRGFGLNLPSSTASSTALLYSSTANVGIGRSVSLVIDGIIQPSPILDGSLGIKRTSVQPAKHETKRRKFPETWLFLNTSSDSRGEASIVSRVPDTITTWIASSFAVSAESKISIVNKNAELEVFLPFFISLQLPTSVIRNEQVVLQANIFNYHTKDLYVMVTLKKSSQFRGLAVVKRGKRTILKTKSGNVVLCIFAKAGRGTAAFFPIIPSSTGNIKISITAKSSVFQDTVIKTLRVESEGAPRSIAYPRFIDLTEKTTYETQLDLNYPPNTVEGSQRMRISLIGDIMGPTLDGLERLVIMPYGCGEQNMVTTAPSVFVYRYFSSIGRLTNEIRQKAENFITIGMQRQWTYRHNDWSFSAFGGEGSGSTWLTAFVLKVFSIASNYVEIDSELITGSTSFLVEIQNPDGSFPENGRVNNRWLQSGASGTVERMTAFVLIALLEAKRASPNLEFQFCEGCMQNLNTAIERASNFLANNLDNQTSVYTVAISAYALTLADHNGAWRARNTLDSLSKGGVVEKYWEMPNETPTSSYGPSTKAVSIEMTAYGLLAYVDTESLPKSLQILKWLIRQRNPYGGFISTQDTVIALEALSKMGAKIYPKNQEPNLDVIFSYYDTQIQKKKFQVNSKNAMIMQLADISTDTTKISIHAWGAKGMTAVFTVSLFYNIYMDLTNKTILLEVNVKKETINGYTLTSCVSWLEDEVSGMIVVEIGIPSGFVANRWGISEHDLLKRTEIEDRKVILYYEEVPYNLKLCTDLQFVRDMLVAKTKPVPCKAYEYYEPSNQMTVFYTPLSAKNANICDICGIECGCQSTQEKIWFPQSWCKKKI